MKQNGSKENEHQPNECSLLCVLLLLLFVVVVVVVCSNVVVESRKATISLKDTSGYVSRKTASKRVKRQLVECLK
jgi:Ca2+/H+ antiporter